MQIHRWLDVPIGTTWSTSSFMMVGYATNSSLVSIHLHLLLTKRNIHTIESMSYVKATLIICWCHTSYTVHPCALQLTHLKRLSTSLWDTRDRPGCVLCGESLIPSLLVVQQKYIVHSLITHGVAKTSRNIMSRGWDYSVFNV